MASVENRTELARYQQISTELRPQVGQRMVSERSGYLEKFHTFTAFESIYYQSNSMLNNNIVLFTVATFPGLPQGERNYF